MLLAIDIGNTNISFGIFKNQKIIKKFDASSKNYSLKKIKAKLQNFIIEDIIICSVAPAATDALKKDLGKLFKKTPLIVGKDIFAPVKNMYRFPQQVGQDRLVNALAGIKLHKAPLIVIDFGTAITFDVINKKNVYLGGMILPGFSISLDALANKTALLPKIKLSEPKELIGRDTKNSILSGIVFGTAALTDNLTEKIKKKIGQNAKIVATGSSASLIAKYCKKINIVDKELTLKGLKLIYEIFVKNNA